MISPRGSRPLMLIAGVALVLMDSPTVAQSTDRQGRTSKVVNGEVGQRQENQAKDLPIDPKARIYNRVQNRLENRIRNRIDRDYDPTADASSPYGRADQRVRRAVKKPSG